MIKRSKPPLLYVLFRSRKKKRIKLKTQQHITNHNRYSSFSHDLVKN